MILDDRDYELLAQVLYDISTSTVQVSRYNAQTLSQAVVDHARRAGMLSCLKTMCLIDQDDYNHFFKILNDEQQAIYKKFRG